MDARILERVWVAHSCPFEKSIPLYQGSAEDLVSTDHPKSVKSNCKNKLRGYVQQFRGLSLMVLCCLLPWRS